MYGAPDETVLMTPPFEIVLRGFDRQQVTDHLGTLQARVATLEAERDAARQRVAELSDQVEHLRREAAEAATEADRLRREAAEAATEVDRLRQSPLSAASARIQRMVQIAVDEATELQVSAEQETISLRESARAEADRLVRETREECERLEAESRSRCQSAEAESAARRQYAEQYSDQDIARREAEMDDWIRDYQTRSITALYLIMQIAGERLSSRVVEVTRQTTALRQLRVDIADQVSAVHRLLVEAVGLVVEHPTAAEQAEQPALSEGSPPQAPAGEAGPSNGRQAPAQRGLPGPGGWYEADQPTVSFGLHP